MPLDRIGPEDVAAWFDAASRDKPGAANRAFEILRAMMFRAEEWGFSPTAGGRPAPTPSSAGYAHLADAHIVEAAEKVGAITAAAMESAQPRGCSNRAAIQDQNLSKIYLILD